MQRQRIVSDYMLCLPCVHAEIVRFLTEWMPSRLAGALRLLRGSSQAPCVRFSLQARRLSSLLNVLSTNVKTYPRPGFIFGSNLAIYLTTDTSLTSSSAHLSTSPPASLSSHRLPHPIYASFSRRHSLTKDGVPRLYVGARPCARTFHFRERLWPSGIAGYCPRTTEETHIGVHRPRGQPVVLGMSTANLPALTLTKTELKTTRAVLESCKVTPPLPLQ